MTEHYGAGFVTGVAASLWACAAFAHFSTPNIVMPALIVTIIAIVFTGATLLEQKQ